MHRNTTRHNRNTCATDCRIPELQFNDGRHRNGASDYEACHIILKAHFKNNEIRFKRNAVTRFFTTIN